MEVIKRFGKSPVDVVPNLAWGFDDSKGYKEDDYFRVTSRKKMGTCMNVLTDISHGVFFGLKAPNGFEVAGCEGSIICPDPLQ